jgi:DNA modification methylase
MIDVRIGDVAEGLRKIPDGSIHCVVTSPPYWGLRNYGSGQLGAEETPEEYVYNIVRVFREVRRVLRDDGIAWLNLGDVYATKQYDGLKRSDLCLIPARVALALQADGWYIRCDVVWNKPNPMPESVRNRPAKCHEYIWMLTKSDEYFYDHFAVKEEAVTKNRWPGVGSKHAGVRDRGEKQEDMAVHPKRNLRSVWTMTTRPFPRAHFATFPPELPEKCILASTSEKGCCPSCGAPWERVVARDAKPPEDVYTATSKPEDVSAVGDHTVGFGQKYQEWLNSHPETTVGWVRTCDCGRDDTVPCTVLDIFAGTGTTGMVAKSLGRDAILLELNPEYEKFIRERIGEGP